LSDSQIKLADAVLSANSNTVLLLINGGMISIDHFKESAPAILECFMPGVHGGTAMAATIFGDNNPGGKLPVTMFHSSYINETDFLSMDMNNGKGRTYKYYQGTPLYEFGYGLSYTNFTLKWKNRQPEQFVINKHSVSFKNTYSVVVTNVGNVAGDEVVMAFTKPNATSFRLSGTIGDTPIEKKKLFGFKRISLQPGGSETVSFDMDSSQMMMVDEDGNTGLHSGSFDIVFSRGHGDVLSAQAVVDVDAQEGVEIVKTLRKWW